MRVRIVGLGTNWWSAHPSDVADPFCFRRKAAWFNSAGLMFGNRLRLCWAYPGQVRFNRSSGFNPEFPTRVVGCVAECSGPTSMHDRDHLLVTRLFDSGLVAEASLVSFTERMCGRIRFGRVGWKSNGTRLISVSLRRDRYEVIALMGPGDWFESSVGRWSLSDDMRGLVLGSAESWRPE